MVTVKVLGSVKRKILATLESEALSRTTRSRILPRSRMKMTNVNSTPPSSACETTSLRMYRVKMRKRIGSSRAHGFVPSYQCKAGCFRSRSKTNRNNNVGSLEMRLCAGRKR